MNTTAAAILKFLETRPDLEHPQVRAARARLLDLDSQLENCAEPHFRELSSRRILASMSLLRQKEERECWDAANAFLSERIGAGESLTVGAILTLNGILTRSEARLRDAPVFGCTEEYLAAEQLPAALAILEEQVLGEADPILKAARVYTLIVNAHPFFNGNGRTARLAADWVLFQAGYPPLCFHSNVQSHVVYGQLGRHRTPDECYIKCMHAVANSYSILLGQS